MCVCVCVCVCVCLCHTEGKLADKVTDHLCDMKTNSADILVALNSFLPVITLETSKYEYPGE